MLLLVFLIGVGSMVTRGQNVRLNIVLHRAQSLTIHPQQDKITLSYSSIEDYKQGVHSLQAAHLSLFSTEAYEVKVKLANSEFISLLDGPSLKASLTGIMVSAQPLVKDAAISLGHVNLGTRESVIISSSQPSTGSTFDVTYSGPKGQELIEFASRHQSITMTNDIMYSIETR